LDIEHDAARADCGPDEMSRRWLDQCETGLAGVLATRPELRRLAEIPLLCGLLCALYQDGNMHLPCRRPRETAQGWPVRCPVAVMRVAR